jgi:predicted DNA-binding protein
MVIQKRNKVTWHDLHVLLPEDVYDKLASLAKADERKPAVYCRMLIEKVLAGR